MIHDPGRSSKRPCPPKDTSENDQDTDPNTSDESIESDGDESERDNTRSDSERDEAGGDAERDDPNGSCQNRTAWLRFLRAVLLAIVAVARLIRAL